MQILEFAFTTSGTFFNICLGTFAKCLAFGTTKTFKSDTISFYNDGAVNLLNSEDLFQRLLYTHRKTLSWSKHKLNTKWWL